MMVSSLLLLFPPRPSIGNAMSLMSLASVVKPLASESHESVSLMGLLLLLG